MTALNAISLRLARCAEFPDGSDAHGYEIVAPLDAEGMLDAEAWRVLRDHCRVRRIMPGEAVRHGRLTHRAGGQDGATWTIDYDDRTDEDDEDGFRLGKHRFAPGEYVSIRDDEGELRTFTVTQIKPA